jgi:hypothetical protein
MGLGRCLSRQMSPCGNAPIAEVVCLSCRLDTRSNDTQALTLSPTRELAEQTQKVRRLVDVS